MHLLDTQALGFISMYFVRSADELLMVHRQLKAYATDHGLHLTEVYVEEPGRPSASFDLLESLLQSDGLPLVVPTLHHLAVLGHPIRIRDHLRHTNHEVFVATKPAERTC